MDLKRAISELKSEHSDIEQAIFAVERYALLGTQAAEAAAEKVISRIRESHRRIVSELHSACPGVGSELEYIQEAAAALENLDRLVRRRQAERPKNVTTMDAMLTSNVTGLCEGAANPSDSSLLVNPHPCSHIVYSYIDDDLVTQVICRYAVAGLRCGESVILVMTMDHYESIRQQLQTEGFDPDEHECIGRLFCFQTEYLLAQLMTDGVPDKGLFKLIISQLIERAKASSRDRSRVRILGEMVSQLRRASLMATIRMEQLWNEIIEAHSVPLLCTYALHDKNDHLPDALIALHSHSI